VAFGAIFATKQAWAMDGRERLGKCKGKAAADHGGMG